MFSVVVLVLVRALIPVSRISIRLSMVLMVTMR